MVRVYRLGLASRTCYRNDISILWEILIIGNISLTASVLFASFVPLKVNAPSQIGCRAACEATGDACVRSRGRRKNPAHKVRGKKGEEMEPQAKTEENKAVSEEDAIRILLEDIPAVLRDICRGVEYLAPIAHAGMSPAGYIPGGGYVRKSKIDDSESPLRYNLRLSWPYDTSANLELDVDYMGGILYYVEGVHKEVTLPYYSPERRRQEILGLLYQRRFTPEGVRRLYEDLAKFSQSAREFVYEYLRERWRKLGRDSLLAVLENARHGLRILQEDREKKQVKIEKMRSILESVRSGLLASKSFTKSKSLARLREEIERVLQEVK